MSIPQIAQQVGKGVRTIHRWLANGDVPGGRHQHKQYRSFDKYALYVLERWKQGYRNGQRLWKEIRSQGYEGSTRQLYLFLTALRTEQVELQSASSSNPAKKKLSASGAV